MHCRVVKNYGGGFETATFLCSGRGCLYRFTRICSGRRVACESRPLVRHNELAYSDVFDDFFPGAFASLGEGPFAVSFEAADFSPPSAAFGAASFLAASLYDWLR